MYKHLIVILFSLFSLSACGQFGVVVDTSPVIDNSGNIITGDTVSASLPEPPDTIKSFIANVANPGDTSALSFGVQAYYSFEETSGLTAYDSAGSYDGTLTNTPTIMQTGKSNYCYTYDYASEEWIDFGTSFWDVGTNDLTVCFWVKYTIQAGMAGGVVGNWGTYPFWYVRLDGAGGMKAVVNFAGVTIETVANAALTAETWYCIAYRLDRDESTSFYINNVLQTDQDDISAHSAVDLSNSNTFAIGRIGNVLSNYYHNGSIDEVSIYNRLLSLDELSELYEQGAGKFWPYGGAGGDSLRIQCTDFDERGDSVRIIANPLGEGRSTSRTDGTLLGAFNMADSADWNDTTMAWPYLKDTTYIIEAYTGLWPEDIWTDPPNYDTTFFDSSNITPPVQDPGGLWDTLFYEDFEDHSAPTYYTTAQFTADFNGQTWRDSDHRWPGWWTGQLKDSIVVDSETSSKVLRFSFEDTIADGYAGHGPRGGDYWQYPFDGFTLTNSTVNEVYYSYNVKLRPGWDFNYGGKFGSMFGGAFLETVERPVYGEGFSAGLSFTGQSPFPYGGLSFYMFYQNSPVSYYGETTVWDDFQPTGDGLQYDENGAFVFDTDPEQWYNITIRLVTNTHTGSTPNYDGIIEGYVNGKLIERKSGLYLITYPDINNLIRVAAANFFGGAENYQAPQRDEWSYLDDIIAFTYDESVEGIPRGNVVSSPGRVLALPNYPKTE